MKVHRRKNNESKIQEKSKMPQLKGKEYNQSNKSKKQTPNSNPVDQHHSKISTIPTSS